MLHIRNREKTKKVTILNLLDILSRDNVILDVVSKNKEDLFVELVDKGCTLDYFCDRELLLKLLQERELLGTTGISKGIAVPHVRTEMVSDLRMVFARCCEGMEYDAIDSKPVQFIFLVVAPPEKNELYLQMMSRISKLLRIEDVRKAILGATAIEEILQVIKNYGCES